MGYIYIAGTVFFTVYGQLILKWRLNFIQDVPESSVKMIYFLFSLLLDPYIVSGLVAAFIASLFWMAAMTKLELSFAYPFVTAGLTFSTVILATLLFNESMSLTKACGVGLILLGVVFMSYSGNS